MATLVYMDFEDGVMARYEIGGEAVRQTHRYMHGGPCFFTPRLVEEFRLTPDEDMRVEPPPRPTNPPASAGVLPMQAAA